MARSGPHPRSVHFSSSRAGRSLQFTRKLPVKLNEEDLRDRGDALAASVQQTAALIEEKKAATADINGKIKLSKEITRRLSEILVTKTEDREVECYVVKDYERNVATIHRSDTGEVIESRLMTRSIPA